MKPHDAGSVLTSGEAAKLCNVNQRTISRWVRNGILAGYKLPGSRHLRITAEVLHAFLLTHHLPIPQELSAPKKQDDPVRILLIDDEFGITQAFARVLRSAGYQIAVENDAFTGSIQLSHFKPHIVILDLHMPGINGLSILHLLRNYVHKPQPKVIVISADTPKKLEQARTLGAVAALSKPLDNKNLLSTVQMIVSELRTHRN